MLEIADHQYLDFHTHRLRRSDDADFVEIVSRHLGKEVDCHYHTIAKHPWWTESIISESEKSELQLRLDAEHCLAMGEMGLDKIHGPSMAEQMDILRSQLNIARDMQLPVIIHCVRAIHQLLQIKKEYPEIKKWCIHGYSRHAVLAQQLIDQGFYLSLMPTMAHTDKYASLVQSIPAYRFFLETDSHPNIKIEDIYLRTAEILDWDIAQIKRQINHNAKEFFER